MGNPFSDLRVFKQPFISFPDLTPKIELKSIQQEGPPIIIKIPFHHIPLTTLLQVKPRECLTLFQQTPSQRKISTAGWAVFGTGMAIAVAGLGMMAGGVTQSNDTLTHSGEAILSGGGAIGLAGLGMSLALIFQKPQLMQPNGIVFTPKDCIEKPPTIDLLPNPDQHNEPRPQTSQTPAVTASL